MEQPVEKMLKEGNCQPGGVECESSNSVRTEAGRGEALRCSQGGWRAELMEGKWR